MKWSIRVTIRAVTRIYCGGLHNQESGFGVEYTRSRQGTTKTVEVLIEAPKVLYGSEELTCYVVDSYLNKIDPWC